jgi:hypothetical protein
MHTYVYTYIHIHIHSCYIYTFMLYIYPAAAAAHQQLRSLSPRRWNSSSEDEGKPEVRAYMVYEALSY